MIALWILIISESLIIGLLAFDKFRRTPSGANILEGSHRLAKVYYKNGSYSSNSGWVWKCSCGVGKLIDNYSNPSEERAMNAWKRHKSLYSELAIESGDDKYKILYEDAQAELEKVKAACYCKDIH